MRVSARIQAASASFWATQTKEIWLYNPNTRNNKFLRLLPAIFAGISFGISALYNHTCAVYNHTCAVYNHTCTVYNHTCAQRSTENTTREDNSALPARIHTPSEYYLTEYARNHTVSKYYLAK